MECEARHKFMCEFNPALIFQHALSYNYNFNLAIKAKS